MTSKQHEAAPHSTVWTLPNAQIVYTAVFIVAAAVVLHRLLYKPRQYKLFPVWAAVEIAITSYLVSEKGWGSRLL